MSRPSLREFVLVMLAVTIAWAILIPLSFWAIDREAATIEAAIVPDTVIKYYGVESVETMDGKVIVKFEPVKEAKP